MPVQVLGHVLLASGEDAWVPSGESRSNLLISYGSHHVFIFYFGFLVLLGSLYSCCLWPSDWLGTVVSSDGLSCTLMPEISMDRANVSIQWKFCS